jgi:5-(carboxyamino)imidazole ribonucleotide synthase
LADFPLPPGSTIGILGGGQLGRMLANAAARLGFDTAVLSPREDSPDARVATWPITADYDDEAALARLAELSDVITFEFENVPASTLERLIALGAEVAPGPKALAFTQDRVTEKTFLNRHGCATISFAAIDSVEDLAPALQRLGAPALLKTRREGYDGKGQAWIRSSEEAPAAFAALGGRPSILEGRADFVRELSIIAARGRDGAVAAYPLGENRHAEGVLRTTLAPAAATPATIEAALTIARAVLTQLDYVGVLGVELFELADGSILVNEIAPRVHNSGHWTQDGCFCDQFEQHIRAVAGWPLGPTAAHSRIQMENLLGPEVERWRDLSADPNARLHLYGKREARPGRKMGHVNHVLKDADPELALFGPVG